uniref:Uncharacterized protein n=1 Tax=Rhizophora mucronata TaxID=61149 RepID=A0A2P2NH25_RHIMU
MGHTLCNTFDIPPVHCLPVFQSQKSDALNICGLQFLWEQKLVSISSVS